MNFCGFRKELNSSYCLVERKEGELTQIRSFFKINKKIWCHLLIIGKNWRLFKEKHLLLNVVSNRKKTCRLLQFGGHEKNRLSQKLIYLLFLEGNWPLLNGLHRVKTE